MADFGNTLKSLANQGRPVWLATPGPRLEPAYAWLAEPATLQAIRAAGFERMAVDLPWGVDIGASFLSESERTEAGLAREIAGSVTYDMMKNRGDNLVTPETLARLQLNARQAGVNLVFVGDPLRDSLSGRDLAAMAAYQYDLQGRQDPSALQAFSRAMQGEEAGRLNMAGRIVDSVNDKGFNPLRPALESHDVYLIRVAQDIREANPDGRILVFHQGTDMPGGQRFDRLLGPDGAARMDLMWPVVRTEYDRLLPRTEYPPADARLDLVTGAVQGPEATPAEPRSRPAPRPAGP